VTMTNSSVLITPMAVPILIRSVSSITGIRVNAKKVLAALITVLS
jgi:ABC-type transport system involved in cytochrome c biogenesis permease component